MRQVGSSGLTISAIGLGTMTWGTDIDEHEAANQLSVYLDAGGSFIDTAAVWGDGRSEMVVGSLLSSMTSRDNVVLCSHAGVSRSASGVVVDNSRSALLRDLQASLDRLETDYLDVWMVQAVDESVDFAETIDTLESVVQRGLVRYVGLANHPAWRCAQAATMSRTHSLCAIGREYSLLNRAIEQEHIPAAEALGMGIIAHAPLGRGVLSGRYRRGIPADSRMNVPHLAHLIEPYLSDPYRRIVEAVWTAAQGLNRSAVDVALSWVLQEDVIASAVVGARTAAQLKEIVSIDELVLPEEILDVLDEVSDLTKV